jgi:hypothetical protein
MFDNVILIIGDDDYVPTLCLTPSPPPGTRLVQRLINASLLRVPCIAYG